MKLFLAILFLSATASADLAVTTYKGSALTGSSCSLIVTKVYFENDIRHPLNERASVVAIFGENLSHAAVISHPAVVDSTKVEFNHDAFHGVSATANGADALIVNMLHTADKEGPDSMVLVQHNWRTDVRTLANCNGLTKAD